MQNERLGIHLPFDVVSPMNVNELLSSIAGSAFEALRTPIWIYDLQTLQWRWANKAARWLWNVERTDDLLSQHAHPMSESIQIHLSNSLEQFQQGKTVQARWTFYPQGQAVLVDCYYSCLSTADGQQVMLVEGSICSQQIFDRPQPTDRLSSENTALDALIRNREHAEASYHNQVEEALRQSEVRFRGIFETSAIGIGLTNLNGDLIDCNAATLKMLGYSREEIEHLNFRDYSHPDDLDEDLRLYQELLAGNRDSYQIEKRYIRKNGQVLWGRLTVSIIRDSQGNPAYTFGMLEDISDCKLVEQALLEERRLFMAGPTIVFKWQATADWAVDYVSQNVYAQLGYLPEAFIQEGLTYRHLIHPEDLERVRQEVQQHTQNGDAFFEQEYRLRHANGEYRWLYDFTTVVRGSDGFATHYLGYVQDVTERKQTEVALQESKALWQYALEGSGDGIWDWNVQTNEIFFSPAWKAMLGFEEDELENTLSQWDNLVHPDDRERIYHALELHLQGKTDQYVSEYRIRCKDGTYKWHFDRGRVVQRTSDGCPQRIIGMNVDISKQKEIEAALRQSEATKQAMLEAIPDLLIRINRAGIRLDFISGGEIKLVCGANRAIHQSIYETLSRRLADQRMYFIHQALETGKRQVYQHEIEIEGALHYEETRIVPINVDEVLVMVRDITDQKQAELTLQKQKEILQAIFDHIPIMLAFFNEQGQVELINREMEQILGWSLSEWKQSNRLTESCSDEAYYYQLLSCIRAVNNQWKDLKARTASGNLLDTSWTTIRLSDGRGISIGQDISKRKRIEENLRQRAKLDRLISAVTQRIHQSLDLDEILHTTVSEIRQVLQTDRVLVCRFEPDASGLVIAESVREDWMSLLGRSMVDEGLIISSRLQSYADGQIQNTSDIFNSDLPESHIEILAHFQVRATLILPILRSETLWGLLMVQHCAEPRVWQSTEVELLTQLSNQMAIGIQQSELYQKLQQVNQELQHLATHDELTQLANRRYFDDYLDQEWNRMAREQSDLAIILCDIDYFKLYNDTYGHLAGDECLARVAQAIGRAIKRPADLAARYGGEEFAIILPNTNSIGAIQVAQEICQEIAQLRLAHAASQIQPWITLSLGIACDIPDFTTSPQQLVNKADRALYKAKENGRNCYHIA